MKEEQFEAWAVDYLRGDLSSEQVKEFENFLRESKGYFDAFEELKDSWELLQLETVPEPSEQMDASFYKQLYTEKHQNQSTKEKWWFSIFSWFRPQYAFGLLLLTAGLLGGYYLKGVDNTQLADSVQLEDDLGTREKLVLTLLEQPSANQRLDGVSEANKIGKVDDKIVEALLKTLNGDPNVNVRLAAIESLTNYVDNAKVRQGLVQSIPNQESPIIQVTLANLMTALQEKKSIAPFKQLLEEKELDTTVKKKIENTIQSII